MNAVGIRRGDVLILDGGSEKGVPGCVPVGVL
jgi:hypothetical protein